MVTGTSSAWRGVRWSARARGRRAVRDEVVRVPKARPYVLQVKLQPDEKAVVTRAARSALLPRATWARQVVLRRAGLGGRGVEIEFARGELAAVTRAAKLASLPRETWIRQVLLQVLSRQAPARSSTSRRKRAR